MNKHKHIAASTTDNIELMDMLGEMSSATDTARLLSNRSICSPLFLTPPDTPGDENKQATQQRQTTRKRKSSLAIGLGAMTTQHDNNLDIIPEPQSPTAAGLPDTFYNLLEPTPKKHKATVNTETNANDLLQNEGALIDKGATAKASHLKMPWPHRTASGNTIYLKNEVVLKTGIIDGDIGPDQAALVKYQNVPHLILCNLALHNESAIVQEKVAPLKDIAEQFLKIKKALNNYLRIEAESEDESIIKKLEELKTSATEYVFCLAVQLFEIVAYVHSQGDIISDLKTANMGISLSDENSSGRNVTLLDPGSIKEKGSELGNKGYTALTVYPGVFEGTATAPVYDIWSIGLMLFELCDLNPTGRPHGYQALTRHIDPQHPAYKNALLGELVFPSMMFAVVPFKNIVENQKAIPLVNNDDHFGPIREFAMRCLVEGHQLTADALGKDLKTLQTDFMTGKDPQRTTKLIQNMSRLCHKLVEGETFDQEAIVQEVTKDGE